MKRPRKVGQHPGVKDLKPVVWKRRGFGRWDDGMNGQVTGRAILFLTLPMVLSPVCTLPAPRPVETSSCLYSLWGWWEEQGTPTVRPVDSSQLCPGTHCLGGVNHGEEEAQRSLRKSSLCENRESGLPRLPRPSAQSHWEYKDEEQLPCSSTPCLWAILQLNSADLFSQFGYTSILPLNSELIREPAPSTDFHEITSKIMLSFCTFTSNLYFH